MDWPELLSERQSVSQVATTSAAIAGPGWITTNAQLQSVQLTDMATTTTTATIRGATVTGMTMVTPMLRPDMVAVATPTRAAGVTRAAMLVDTPAGAMRRVVVEHQRGERYVPVIREEIIEETYETTEYETVRERVTDYVPLPVEHPQPRGDKRIRYTKQR